RDGEGRGAGRGVGARRSPAAGVVAGRDRHGARRRALADRPRARRERPPGRPPERGLPDHAEGARAGLPARPPPPLAPVVTAARAAPRAQRGDPRLPRVPRRPRLPRLRRAHSDAGGMRGHDHPLPRPVLRRDGVPDPVGAALRRGRRDGLRQGVLLRADLPCREVEDAPASHRVLDGRARDGLRRPRPGHGPGRGLPRARGQRGAQAPPARAARPRSRSGTARARAEALPARHLRRGARPPPLRLRAARRLRHGHRALRRLAVRPPPRARDDSLPAPARAPAAVKESVRVPRASEANEPRSESGKRSDDRRGVLEARRRREERAPRSQPSDRSLQPPWEPESTPTLTARNPLSMRAAAMRTPLLAVCLLALVTGVAGAQEGEQETARPRRARPAAAARPAAPSTHADEDRALLHQLADAQRSLGEQVQQLKDVLEALRADMASQKDEDAATEQEVKALREEVKGLYVESSGVKQQIDALKDDIGGVNSNVSGFRTYSGFFIAVMILLLAVIFVLTIRR